jgi:hypothetical protein
MTHELIPPDSRDRCQRLGPSGQCTNPVIPGTDFCEQHTSKLAKRRLETRKYAIENTRLRASVGDFAGSEAIYSMREEIAILRSFIEQLIRSLDLNDSEHSRAQCAATAPMVIKLVETLERVVKTSGVMEVKFGHMLSKQAVIDLANMVVGVMAEEISHLPNYQEIVDRVTQRVTENIRKAENDEDA